MSKRKNKWWVWLLTATVIAAAMLISGYLLYLRKRKLMLLQDNGWDFRLF